MAVDTSVVAIDYARDSSFDAFALQTLQERYMLPGETSPQEAFARASAAFADDAAHAERLYGYAARHWFMFATPILANGGSNRGLPISCFLPMVEDSRESIFDHWAEMGWLSSSGGGIGTYWGALRSKGERTKKGSSSTGVIPFIAVDDRVILAVSQGDTRRGSEAVYLDVHHPEIREFLGIRKKAGGDANRKALNLHQGVNITDEFMAAVWSGEPFGLRSPKTGEVIAWEDARELWKLILDMRKQYGEPYLFFVDTANRGLPPTQKAKGLKVHHSNLCVAGSTELLTRAGYAPIEGLVGQEVEVWNGEQWSKVTVEQTAEAAELVRVWFEDGGYLDCTPYHKFHTDDGREVRAGALKPGTVLEEVRHPQVEYEHVVPLDVAYASGWATFAGYEDANRVAVFAPESAGEAVLKRLMSASVDMVSTTIPADGDEPELLGHTVRYEPQTLCAGVTPLAWSRKSRLAWLGGALDACADWIEVDGRWYLCLGSDDRDLIMQMRLMALELGLFPRIRLTDTLNAFMLPAACANALVAWGNAARHERKPVSIDLDYLDLTPTVADVQPLPYQKATYCFSEPLRHRGVFAGVLTGQCTEITLPAGRDDDGIKRTPVCCLSSPNAEKFDEWKDHPLFIEDLMRMLDNVLTDFIRRAPPELADAVYSAYMERSVGLGLMGLHAYFQKHNVAYESRHARQLGVMIAAHIRRHADAASLLLGAERGEAPDMEGTGHRFAHRIAYAPNASSSILIGTSAATELRAANVYLHKTLSGSFTVKNPYLERELEKFGLNTPEVWKQIVAHEGSIQFFRDRVDFEIDASALEHLLDVFKTAAEVDQRWVVQHAIDRQPFVDQAQSINLFFGSDADPDEVSQIHIMAWLGGLKSLYYFRGEAAGRAENVNAKVERAKVQVQAEPEIDLDDLGALVAGSALAPPDPTCIMCEG